MPWRVLGFATYKYITKVLVQTFLASLLFFLQDVWTNTDLNCFTCVSVRVCGTVSSLKRFRNAFKF